MLKEVFNLLPVLVVAMTMNTLTGVYQKVGVEKIPFNWNIFCNGVIKLFIILGCLVGCAYCCEQVAFLELNEFAPHLIMQLGITGYVGKVAYNLLNIIKTHVSDNTVDPNEG
jgi:hypothetical protein